MLILLGVFQYRLEVLQTRKGDFTIQLDRKKSIFEGITLLIIQALKLTFIFYSSVPAVGLSTALELLLLSKVPLNN